MLTAGNPDGDVNDHKNEVQFTVNLGGLRAVQAHTQGNVDSNFVRLLSIEPDRFSALYYCLALYLLNDAAGGADLTEATVASSSALDHCTL